MSYQDWEAPAQGRRGAGYKARAIWTLPTKLRVWILRRKYPEGTAND